MHDGFEKTTKNLTDLNLSVQYHNFQFTTKLLRILTRCLQSTQMTTFTHLLDSLRVPNPFILQKDKCILAAQCRTLSLVYYSLLNPDFKIFCHGYGRRGATHSIRTFWVRPTISPPYADSPQVNHYITPSLRFSNISVRARYYTEHNTPTGDYCIMLHMVIYCLTTHSKTLLPLRAYTYGVTHDVNRTICFSVKYMSYPTYL